jgi:hypothetical protein
MEECEWSGALVQTISWTARDELPHGTCFTKRTGRAHIPSCSHMQQPNGPCWQTGLLPRLSILRRLLRNHLRILHGDELESESVRFGAEFRFLSFLVAQLIGGETRIVELLPAGDEVEDDAGQLVCCKL